MPNSTAIHPPPVEVEDFWRVYVKRDHIEKYSLPYANTPEFLETHQEEAERMLQEKLKEMGQAPAWTSKLDLQQRTLAPHAIGSFHLPTHKCQSPEVSGFL
jgi:hypothetical protein